MDETLQILVVGNNPLARMGLVSLLRERTTCEVVGQVAADTELANYVDIYEPDVMVWDMGSMVSESLQVIDQVDGLSAIPIAALIPDEEIAGAVWNAGVQALLLQTTDASSLAAALQAIAHGLLVLDPVFASAMISTADTDPLPLVEALTERELEVLQLLAEGLSNKAIALDLGISDHTVKFHVNAIMGKLDAQNRTEDVVRATRLGLIML